MHSLLNAEQTLCSTRCRIDRLHNKIQSTRSTVGYLINYKRLDNLLFQMYRERREKNYLNSGTFGLIYRQSNFRLSNSIKLYSFNSLRLGTVIEHNRHIVPPFRALWLFPMSLLGIGDGGPGKHAHYRDTRTPDCLMIYSPYWFQLVRTDRLL